MQIRLKYFFLIVKILSIISSHTNHAESEYDNKKLY